MRQRQHRGPPVTVEAEASGGTVDELNLSYTVYNRSDIAVSSDRVTMSKGSDGTYSAEIPGQPAGYRVEYEVRGYFEDGSQASDSANYTVQLIKSLSNPEGTTESERSTLQTELYSTESVQNVTFTITKRVQGSQITVTENRTIESVQSRNLSVAVDNTVFGAGASTVNISYNVTVTYGASGETQTVTSDTRSYLYENTAEKVLYVPVSFEGGPNTEPAVRSTLTDKANKTARYYNIQSEGEVEMQSDWLINSSTDAYFTLPEPRGDYYNQSDESYNRTTIMCDGEQMVEQRTNTDPDNYDDIIFVTAEQEDSFVRGLASYKGPGCTYDSDILGPDTIVVSVEHPYSTWAHEFGHAFYRWGDYYGGGEVSGEVGSFALMGSSRLDTHAATVMPYHPLDQGWANQTEIPAVNDSEPTASQELQWLSQDGDVAKFNPETDSFGDGNGVYQYVLIGARDSSKSPVPPHGSRVTSEYQDDDQFGSGANVYLVTEPSVFGVIRDDPKIDRVENPSGLDPKETVTLRPSANDTIKDPDLGYNISANATAGGVDVEVEHTEPENLSGINLYTLIECEDRDTTSSGECQQLTGAPSGNTSAVVAARFVGPNGTVGQYSNGTTVQTLNGSRSLQAGRVQKIYVPRSSDATLNVSVDQPDANVSVSLKTQAVTRDEDGNRTASSLRTVNLSDNSSYEPELARLNTSRSRWNAGSLRTLETNETTIAVENNGIRSLDNVTVTTNSSWVTVNQSEVGTIEDASRVPIRVRTTVPGGTPVGTYTFNVTVRGTGTAGTQTKRVPVTVTVLPTARWNTTLAGTNATFAEANKTTITYEISNDNSSNVPLRDVKTSVSGNVTELAIDDPETIRTLEAGSSRNLTLSIQVPENGTEAGDYTGDISVSPLQNYSRYFVYPVPIPTNYSTLTVAERRASVKIDARGPATTTNATFHPKKQVAMRKGSATERITVDTVDTAYDVPAQTIRIKTEIPAGWQFQDWSKV